MKKLNRQNAKKIAKYFKHIKNHTNEKELFFPCMFKEQVQYILSKKYGIVSKLDENGIIIVLKDN